MKAHTCSTITLTALAMSAALSSCVYYPHPVPEMPYSPRRVVAATPTPAATPAPAPATPAPAALPAPQPAPTPWAAPAAHTEPDPFPAPMVVTPKPAPSPAPAPAKASTAITKPAPVKAPAPVTKPAAAPAPIPAPAPIKEPTKTPAQKLMAGGDPSKITNDGPIPVATRVEGDPTRVYNPLDPSKTIRIIDKNGNVFPSGKELKVRGTNYHFYVP